MEIIGSSRVYHEAIGRVGGDDQGDAVERTEHEALKRLRITEVEIQVFERWFDDVFDELLSPKVSQGDFLTLSDADKNKP